MRYGLGGPGSGFLGESQQMPNALPLQDRMELMRAGGFGMGPWGYGLGYGISPFSQQALWLNHQWGMPRYRRGAYSE